MRNVPLCLLVCVCFGLTACMGGRKKPFVLVPVAWPAAEVVDLPEDLPSPVRGAPAGAEPVAELEMEPVLQPTPEEPVKAATARTVRRRSPAVVAQPAAPAADAATLPPALETPPVRLGAILSPERREHYQSALSRSLTAARAAIRQTGAMNLNTAQRDNIGRIQTFIRQAEEMSGQDLATAVQLARRAELLGEDLVRSAR